MNNLDEIINRLNDMFLHVDAEPPLFTTIYNINDKRGEVNYELINKVGVKKPIKQTFNIILSVNMTHIIEHFNPQSEEELTLIRMGIMEHSKKMVQDYQNDN